MRMLEIIRSKKEVIADIGTHESAEARKQGVSSYYVDPEVGDGLKEERANGEKVAHSHCFLVKPGVHAAG
ncbi:hypothetical protein [Rhizobium sp. LC145]|uniref:hypothetical protein n=1 Tax=Rhizobium sp. LC145 TaxID=1120688 RepID=UPI00062A0D3D|nr:hypothetical protein [Rhizobium sp. LC145]KKX33923.1 hypothetical protein YH62_01725 [Rhizobium sp. LC145]TKT44267.1 hypothetical protein FDR95_26245 [Rhizobiaceae bacterium LC148]